MIVQPQWRLQGAESLPHPLRACLEELERRFTHVQGAVQGEMYGTRNTRIVPAAAHGSTAILEAWGHDASDWVKAKATLAGEMALGLTVGIPDIDHLEIAAAGWQLLPAHGKTIGKYWLSSTTAGAITTTQPSALPGTKVQLVCQVVDVDNIIMFPTESMP